MLIMALVVLTGGMAYEAIGRLLDARPFPVRGRMVDIGGYRLNINCTGIGSPAGILESGLGESARSWIGVQSGVERFTRSALTIGLAMGRVNLVRNRSSLQIARELHFY